MAILAFGKFSFDFGPLPVGVAWAPRPSLSADDAASHPHGSQVSVVRLAVIGLVARGLAGVAIYQGGKLLAVRLITGSSLDLHNKLRIGVLHLMGLIAIERLFLALAAKTSVRVRGVPVNIMVVIVAPLTLMLFLQAKQVHPGADMGGVDKVEGIGNEAPVPGLLHHLIEQFLKACRSQVGPEAAEGREIGGATPRHSGPGTICRPG